MHILVTGGAGFIGSHLTEELVKKGIKVSVFDNFSTGRAENIEHFKKKITLIRADLADRKAVFRATRGVDLVFHQAALTSVQQSLRCPEETQRSNVLGTLHLFQASVKHRVKRVVYASTCAIYGEGSEGLKKENGPVQPISFYAESKRVNETHAFLFRRYFGLRAVGLRYFNVFGPRQCADSAYSGVISVFLKKFRNGKSPVIFGNGKQTRDFVYVKDVVRANLLAGRHPRCLGEVFNVGTGRAVSLNELVRILNRVFKSQMKAHYEEARPGDIRYSVADLTKIRRALSFSPRYSLYQGLEAMARGIEA